MSWARQILATVTLLTPNSSANSREDQYRAPRCSGGGCRVAAISSSGSMARGRRVEESGQAVAAVALPPGDRGLFGAVQRVHDLGRAAPVAGEQHDPGPQLQRRRATPGSSQPSSGCTSWASTSSVVGGEGEPLDDSQHAPRRRWPRRRSSRRSSWCGPPVRRVQDRGAAVGDEAEHRAQFGPRRRNGCRPRPPGVRGREAVSADRRDDRARRGAAVRADPGPADLARPGPGRTSRKFSAGERVPAQAEPPTSTWSSTAEMLHRMQLRSFYRLQPQTGGGVVVPERAVFDVAAHDLGGAPAAVAHDGEFGGALGVALGGEPGAQ